MLKTKDQEKYTQESGVAVYKIDDKTIEFYVWWQEKKGLNESSQFQSYMGKAEKRGVGNIYRCDDYLVKEMPELDAVVFLELKGAEIDVWVETNIPTQRGGLADKEKLTFK